MTPCKNCILLATCRRKYFDDMKEDCSIIKKYLFRGKTLRIKRADFMDRMIILEKVLSPLYWEVWQTKGENENEEVGTVDHFSYKRRAKPLQGAYFRYSGPAGDFK